MPSVDRRVCYQLGPSSVDGPAFTARAVRISKDNWGLVVKARPAHRSTVAALFNECFARSWRCPTGQVAVVFQGQVVVSPVVQSPNVATNPQGFEISGPFDRNSAQTLADQINQ